jgi:hypothetical protein
MMPLSPFDFVRQIQSGKQDLMTDDLSEKEYIPFVVNRTLSYEMDCLFYTNEMNMRAHCDKKLQNHYLLGTVRSRKRPFHKWSKAGQDDLLDDVKLFFGYSDKRALEAIELLTQEQLEEISEKTDPGGRVGRKNQKV